MKSRFSLITFIFLFFSVNAFSEAQFDRLVKDQQRNDNNTLRENRVERKDVFSSKQDVFIENIKIPNDEVCYKIDELSIKDDFLDDQTLTEIRKKVAKTCLGVNGIQRVATLVQDYYINAGYVTTRIETPTQNLASGKLLLQVIPGRIEKVLIGNDDIRKIILPFIEGEILNLRDIEQGLENLQKTPNSDVKINIVPGSKSGYSNIVINTNRTKAWNVRTAYNNWGDKSTGQFLAGGAGYLYNVAGLNDVFYLSGTSSTAGAYKNVSAWYNFPFGFWDYEVLYSNSESRQGIAIGHWNYDYIGINEYLSLKGSRTLYRDMDKKITGSLEMLRRKSAYELDGIKLALQKRDMGNLRLALNYKQNFSDATLDSTISWQRFITWFGGSKTPDMLSGDADSASHLFNLNLTYTKWLNVLPVQSWYEINLGAQYTQAALTLQDQFTIGNRWSVRGFENSTGLDGNKGFYMQNTLNFATNYDSMTAYLGADYGLINNSGYSQGAYGCENLLGAVSGIKGTFQSLGYDFSLSVPLIYPSNLSIDKVTTSFNISYQL